MNRKECEKACLYLLNHCYEEHLINDGTYRFTPSGFKQSEIFKKLIEERFDPKPYKFEDLKVGMWVWDNVEKKCNKIIEILENEEISFYYITDNVSRYIVKFEENRFFPVTKAMIEG